MCNTIPDTCYTVYTCLSVVHCLLVCLCELVCLRRVCVLVRLFVYVGACMCPVLVCVLFVMVSGFVLAVVKNVSPAFGVIVAQEGR